MSSNNINTGRESNGFEEKFFLIRITDNIYHGKYPLLSFTPGARGTYGGELLAQGMLAAWMTVEDKELSPHSFHSYFLKAGSSESVMEYEIIRTSDGRNYSNRMVQAFQKHNHKLCFTMNISFSRNNSHELREHLHEKDPSRNLPMTFQKPPNYIFDKYHSKLDEMPFFGGINKHIDHIIPSEYFKRNHQPSKPAGSKDFGFFFRMKDSWVDSKNQLKTKMAELVFASDSFWLGTLTNELGLPLNRDNFEFFRVSLDHSIFFHDIDYDPTKWMFLEHSFTRLGNDRILGDCRIYSDKKKLIASFTQEALVFIPKKLSDIIASTSNKL